MTQDTKSGSSSAVFAFVKDFGQRETRNCGIEFIYAGRRKFGDVARSSDSPDRLAMIAGFSNRPAEEIFNFEFDIWMHQETGATVVVPAGAELVERNGYCEAQSDDGNFSELVASAPAPNVMMVQQISVQFEQAYVLASVMGNFGMSPDPLLTLNGPQFRQDGLTVNRKGLTAAMSNPYMPPVQASHIFWTLMSRGGSFVGIRVLNRSAPQCYNPMGQMVLCDPNPAYLSEWARFVLATQMSTYPIY